MVDPATRTFAVRVRVADPAPALQWGMTANVDRRGEPARRRPVSLPSTSVYHTIDGRPAVWVFDPAASQGRAAPGGHRAIPRGRRRRRLGAGGRRVGRGDRRQQAARRPGGAAVRGGGPARAARRGDSAADSPALASDERRPSPPAARPARASTCPSGRCTIGCSCSISSSCSRWRACSRTSSSGSPRIRRSRSRSWS